MRILQVHNYYRIQGGEDVLFNAIVQLLQEEGISVSTFTTSSQEIQQDIWQKSKAFVNGFYSVSAARAMGNRLIADKPSLVHFHNVYPNLSPSVIQVVSREGVPALMSCHNYRLICPIGVFFRDGAICEQCANGREYHCIINNCRKSMAESIAYASRGAFARRTGYFKKHIDLFLAVSNFVKQELIAAGFPENRIVVLPNMASIEAKHSPIRNGNYVAFVGRISEEKGIQTLLEANRNAKLPVKVAGPIRAENNLNLRMSENEQFVGKLQKLDLIDFIDNARFLVVPSRWYEAFGLVAVEAMMRGKPVIASKIGALTEIIDHGSNGFQFPPGDSLKLAEMMTRLWNDAALCKRMGEAAREKAQREYSRERYFLRLMSIYNGAIQHARSKKA